MNNKIRLIIADDHELFRAGLINLINQTEDLAIVDYASDGLELVNKYAAHNPNVVVSDISMPVLSGFESFKEIRKFDDHAKFLFLSMFESSEYVYYTRKIGGKGLLSKNVRINELCYGIRLIHNGLEYFGMDWTREKLDNLNEEYKNLADGVIGPDIFLTYKEKKILFYISEGFTSSEIAEEMNVSKRTIDAHRYNLMKKINASTPSQLIAFAIKFTSFKNSYSSDSNPSK